MTMQQSAPTRLAVSFTGFHVPVPDLRLRVSGGDPAGEFRRRVAEHVSRYTHTKAESLTINGNPDSPEGAVEVDSGAKDPAVAGRFQVEPDTTGGPAPQRVPSWLVIVLIVAAIWVISQM